ncbi:MAG: ABC transporter permease, partial [Actinomycetota bacterium]
MRAIQLSNPILTRELKERMRTLRAPVVLTIYLLILGLVAFAAERIMARDAAFNPGAAAGLGRAVFHFLLFFTLMLICFLVPGFTASSISSERERQTFPLLQVTLLRPSAIVFGKLVSSMAYMMLLVLATLPLISVSFILGGVSPLEVLRGYGMVILTGFTIAMVGLGLSATLRKTVSATVLSYALVGLLCIGTVVSYGLTRVIVERSGRNPTGHVWALVVNPFVGTASAIRSGGAVSGPSTPFTSLFDFISPQIFPIDVVDGGPQFFQGRGFTKVIVGGDGATGVVRAVPVPAPFPPNAGDPGLVAQPFQPVQPPHRLPVWVSTVVWYGVMSALGFLLAVNGVRAPARGLRLGRRRRRGALEA